MKAFGDISLYLPTPHTIGTPEYNEEVLIGNFVSDLYVQKMNGYKPPKTTRITIQPQFHGIWNRTWKTGSIVAIAPYFNHEEFSAFDTKGKYKYILNLIQNAAISLSDEYGWDKAIFEAAYKEVLESDFIFKVNYPVKLSKDRKSAAKLVIEKTETTTSVYVNIESNVSSKTHKLFDKANTWWYDWAYILARHDKWFDKDRFGISYNKGKIEVWYSIQKDEVELFENGNKVMKIDFKKHFTFG